MVKEMFEKHCNILGTVHAYSKSMNSILYEKVYTVH